MQKMSAELGSALRSQKASNRRNRIALCPPVQYIYFRSAWPFPHTITSAGLGMFSCNFTELGAQNERCGSLNASVVKIEWFPDEPFLKRPSPTEERCARFSDVEHVQTSAH